MSGLDFINLILSLVIVAATFYLIAFLYGSEYPAWLARWRPKVYASEAGA